MTADNVYWNWVKTNSSQVLTPFIGSFYYFQEHPRPFYMGVPVPPPGTDIQHIDSG